MNTYWLVFTEALPGVVVAFGVGESYAIVRKKPTYTEWIRRQLGLYPVTPRRWWAAPLFALLLGGFTAWFLPHILLGIWPS